MAHMIDETTGRAAIAYMGETPWHTLGKRMSAGASTDDWRVEAGLDYTVERSPVQYQNGALHVYAGRNVLYRSDTGAPLSIVSDDYHEVQPAQVMEFFRDITEAGGFTLETAGALSGGKRIWALARVNDGAEVVGHDVVRPYLLLATSYDASMATTAKFTAVRVVCHNTISMAVPQYNPATGRASAAEKDKTEGAVVDSVRVLHRERFDPAQVKLQLGVVTSAFDRFLINSRLLAEKRLTPSAADLLTFDLIAPTVDPKRDPRESRGYKRIMALFGGGAKGADIVGNDNAWAWLNAATQYVDWERGRTPDTRLNSAWFGAGDTLKSKALELAMGA